ncbi:MAG: SOS response-associated peptidase [Lachnospiraceae bacterium]|nr:SOS response-associated peptidase [Lachnospiraceae bacterium]
MCGRYHVDDKMTGEIAGLIRQINRGQGQGLMKTTEGVAGEVCPGKAAPILSESNGSIQCVWQYWGFPGYREKQLIFNARCESALEKPLFRDCVRSRRVVIPAARFYEWNPGKEKNSFQRKDKSVLFMAGLSRRYEDGEHFVILTTAANMSMEPVHDRMPLILEREEIETWIWDGTKTEDILHKIPCLLERRSDYEQMSLF